MYLLRMPCPRADGGIPTNVWIDRAMCTVYIDLGASGKHTVNT